MSLDFPSIVICINVWEGSPKSHLYMCMELLKEFMKFWCYFIAVLPPPPGYLQEMNNNDNKKVIWIENGKKAEEGIKWGFFKKIMAVNIYIYIYIR